MHVLVVMRAQVRDDVRYKSVMGHECELVLMKTFLDCNELLLMEIAFSNA